LKTLLRGNKRYSQGAGLTTIAILISTTLLLIGKFIPFEKKPMKFQVVHLTKQQIKNVLNDGLQKTIIIPIPKKSHS